jgi:hypothetical protein
MPPYLWRCDTRGSPGPTPRGFSNGGNLCLTRLAVHRMKSFDDRGDFVSLLGAVVLEYGTLTTRYAPTLQTLPNGNFPP